MGHVMSPGQVQISPRRCEKRLDFRGCEGIWKRERPACLILAQGTAEARSRVEPLLSGHRIPLSKKATEFFTGHQADEVSKEEWRRKRVGWLCKELAVRSGHEIFRLLKDQRKWMKLVDAQKVMEQLMLRRHLSCCYYVYKWTLQQPWYELDYGLATRLANLLSLDRKAGKAHHLLQVLLASGMPPDASTFSSTILAYVKEGREGSLRQAWAVYNQMVAVGGYDPPQTLQNKLFFALASMAEDVAEFGQHAAVVFYQVRASGRCCSAEMYWGLMRIYSSLGEGEKLFLLVEQMRKAGLRLGCEGFTCIMRLCSKKGDVQGAERAWLGLVKAGHDPTAGLYLLAMKTYRKAGLPWGVYGKFMDMVSRGIQPGYKAYLLLIQSLADAGEEPHALDVLEQLRCTGLSPMLPAYNAVMEMHLRLGHPAKVKHTFESMLAQACRPNRDSYNVLLQSYLVAGLMEEAEEVCAMLAKYRRNDRTYRLMVSGYGKQGELGRVKEVAAAMSRHSHAASQLVSAADGISSGEMRAAKLQHDLKLSTHQREALVGLLLAGAQMHTEDDGLTYQVRYAFGNTSCNAVALLLNLETLFYEWLAPSQDLNPSCQLATVSHSSFRFYASQYRQNGAAVIPRLIHRFLSPRALAYWYMYGGCRCDTTGTIILHTSACSSEEHISLLSHAFQVKGLVCESKNNINGSFQLKDKQALAAWMLMEPHIVYNLKDSYRPRL